MPLDYPMADGKSQPRSSRQTAGSSFEQTENAVAISGLHTNSVIRDRNAPEIAILPGVNVNYGWPLASVLDRVSDEVLK